MVVLCLTISSCFPLPWKKNANLLPCPLKALWSGLHNSPTSSSTTVHLAHCAPALLSTAPSSFSCLLKAEWVGALGSIGVLAVAGYCPRVHVFSSGDDSVARSNSEGFEKLDFGENLCGVPHSYEKWHLQYEFELKEIWLKGKRREILYYTHNLPKGCYKYYW